GTSLLVVCEPAGDVGGGEVGHGYEREVLTAPGDGGPACVGRLGEESTGGEDDHGGNPHAGAPAAGQALGGPLAQAGGAGVGQRGQLRWVGGWGLAGVEDRKSVGQGRGGDV